MLVVWWSWCGVALTIPKHRWGQLRKSHKRVYPKTRAWSEKVSTKGGHINAQTAVEEFEYSFLCMYVLKSLCTCVLRISVEEYGYLFHRKVQDPLIHKLNCHRIFLPFNSHRKKRQLSRMGKFIPVYDCAGNFFEEHGYPFRSKVYQFQVSAKRVSLK